MSSVIGNFLCGVDPLHLSIPLGTVLGKNYPMGLEAHFLNA